jgi:rRNA pseudouridine-1189 N-methylase Emg1 (Nep1/Mra1 family)
MKRVARRQLHHSHEPRNCHVCFAIGFTITCFAGRACQAHHVPQLDCGPLQVVKGPVTRYLPADAYRIGFSHKAPEVHDIFDFVRTKCPSDKTLVFVVGAFAHGKVDAAYVDAEISISHYPLSAAQALSRITNACEQRWNIV